MRHTKLGARLSSRYNVWEDLSRIISGRRLSSSSSIKARIPDDGLSLGDFVSKGSSSPVAHSTPSSIPYFTAASSNNTFHLKTYGCQMNVSDSDIVRSLLLQNGLKETDDEAEADFLFTNTCAIREGAESKVWGRLRELRARRRSGPKKKRKRMLVGVLGCMAERLKEDLLKDGMADIVVGPDAYRDLPRLIQDVWSEDIPVEQAVNVQLSVDETYADITPVRRNADDVSAFVSIQRGCANRCSFCIVPFTRGQERSRSMESIVEEIRRLVGEEDLKEVTLLGQNVNSYHDTGESALAARPSSEYTMSNEGFKSRIRRVDGGYYFADLLANVSDLTPELRVRFTSPHPKDYPAALLDLMSERHNICNQLHMPAQSGSTTMLRRMKRGYSRDAYLDLVLNEVLPRIPDVAISSDFIAGFCGETEEEHQDTLSLMEAVRYDQAFMFAYSMREKTHAHQVWQDDVPQDVKQRRLREIIDVFQRNVHQKNDELEVGKFRCVLVEGESKRSNKDGVASWQGRTDQNKRIFFPVENEGVLCWEDTNLRTVMSGMTTNVDKRDLFSGPQVSLKKGDYAVVQVTEAKGPTLRGRLLWRTTMQGFSELKLDTRHAMLDEMIRDRDTTSFIAAV